MLQRALLVMVGLNGSIEERWAGSYRGYSFFFSPQESHVSSQVIVLT